MMQDLSTPGKRGQEIGGWINFREETACVTEEWLVALADAWPSSIFRQTRFLLKKAHDFFN
jgi:hypothetical protein